MIRSSLESKLYIRKPLGSYLAPGTRDKSSPSFPNAWSLIVLASLVVLVLLAYRTRGASFRWDLFLATLDHVDWRWLAASICLILLSNVGRALRWQVMLRPFGHPDRRLAINFRYRHRSHRRGPARARRRSGPALSDRRPDRPAVLFPSGGLAAGAHARSARGLTALWLCPHTHSGE